MLGIVLAFSTINLFDSQINTVRWAVFLLIYLFIFKQLRLSFENHVGDLNV